MSNQSNKQSRPSKPKTRQSQPNFDQPPPGDDSPQLLAPHSVEAEESLLGALLINPELFPAVYAMLPAAAFFILRNQYVYEAMVSLYTDKPQMDIDNITVMERLKEHGRLDDIGGGAYLTYLINNTATSLHSMTYAEIVRRAWVRRQWLETASEIAQLANSDDTDLPTITDEIVSMVSKVVNQASQTRPYITQDEALSEYMNQVMAAAEGQAQPIIETGLYALDKALGGGLRYGQLMTVAAPPKHCKTGLLLSLAYKFARDSKHVLYCSREMSALEMMGRQMAMVGKVSNEQQHGELTAPYQTQEGETITAQDGTPQSVLDRIVATSSQLGGIPLYWTYEPNIDRLLAIARSLALQGKLDVLIIDYAGIMDCEGDTEERRQSTVFKKVKSFVHGTEGVHAAAIVAAQLNDKGTTFFTSEPARTSDLLCHIELGKRNGVEMGQNEPGVRYIRIVEARNVASNVSVELRCIPALGGLWANPAPEKKAKKEIDL